MAVASDLKQIFELDSLKEQNLSGFLVGRRNLCMFRRHGKAKNSFDRSGFLGGEHAQRSDVCAMGT